MNKIKAINFCQRAAEFFLWLVIFYLPISIALTNIGIGFAVFFCLLRKIISKDWRLPKTPLNITFILLILISLLSMVNSIKMKSSIGGLEKLFKGLVLFFAIVETVDNRKKLNRIIWAALLGLGLVSIDGVFQYFTGKDFIRGYPLTRGLKYLGQLSSPRVRASTHNPNSLAVYLIVLVPLLLSMVLFYLKGLKRWLSALAGLMALFCLFFTFQRITAAGFLIIMMLFSAIKRNAKPIIILFVLIIVAISFLPEAIIQWSLDHLNPYDFFIEEGGRRWHWQAAMNMIKAHPFIGVGVNTFPLNYDRYKIPTDPISGWYAHNAYLNLAAEIGIIGLAIFFWMIIAVIRSWHKTYEKIKDSGLQAISLGVFCGFIGYLISGILESNLQYSNLAVLFWFVLGLMVAVSEISAKEALK
jgi:putative inorganic carbon (HCO3(-)) transporter